MTDPTPDAPLKRLKRRAEFLAANAGARAPTPGFVLLVRGRDDGDAAKGVGFTVSKKVGNAVTRNRLKRRLRALTRAVLPEAGAVGADHVLIGRTAGVERDFAALRGELIGALKRAAKGGSPRRDYPRHSREGGNPLIRKG